MPALRNASWPLLGAPPLCRSVMLAFPGAARRRELVRPALAAPAACAPRPCVDAASPAGCLESR